MQPEWIISGDKEHIKDILNVIMSAEHLESV